MKLETRNMKPSSITIWIHDRRSHDVWKKTVVGKLTIKKALKDAPTIILEKSMIFIARGNDIINIDTPQSNEKLLPGDNLNVVFLPNHPTHKDGIPLNKQHWKHHPCPKSILYRLRRL